MAEDSRSGARDKLKTSMAKQQGVLARSNMGNRCAISPGRLPPSKDLKLIESTVMYITDNPIRRAYNLVAVNGTRKPKCRFARGMGESTTRSPREMPYCENERV